MGRPHAIIAHLSTAASRDDFVEQCLTTIVEALHADRALAFLTDAAGATVTLEARGPGRRLSPAEQTESAAAWSTRSGAAVGRAAGRWATT